jgi:hypothetical protein
MPYRLKNARVLFISVVKDPATGRQFLFKSGDGAPVFDHSIEFRKADDDRQIIYGVAYPAGDTERLDAHGDFATPDDVRAMAEDFMRTGRVIAGVDRDHDYRPIDAFVAESWIVRKGDPMFGDPADEGAWAVGVKIASKSLYDEFKHTGYRGFSIAGTAERVEVKKSSVASRQSPADESLLSKIRKLFSKEEEMSQDVKDAIAELAKQVKEQGEKIAALGKSGEKPVEKPVEKKAGEDTGAPGMTEFEKKLLARIDALEKSGKPDERGALVKALNDAIDAGDLAAVKTARDALAEFDKAGGDTGAPEDTDSVQKKLAEIGKRLDEIGKTKPGSAQVEATEKANGAVSKGIGIL